MGPEISINRVCGFFHDILVPVVDLYALLSLVVIIYVFLAYFVHIIHPDDFARIVDPMLKPIRKLVPLVGMIDFSPFILLIIIQIVGRIVIAVLRSIA
jgi:YggT family protein